MTVEESQENTSGNRSLYIIAIALEVVVITALWLLGRIFG
jgi:hypothetical protein